MADTKISALPASTTPLAGSETLPIVQGGVTKKVSVADLTAGRAPSVSGLTVSGLTASTALALNASKELVSVTNTGTGDNVLATAPTLVGDVTLSTGNLVVADGKGIDFSATPGTGTSELLADYEEGTWTPIIVCVTTPGVGTYTGQAGTYTKIGNRVFINAFVGWSAHTGTGSANIGGLPFNRVDAALSLQLVPGNYTYTAGRTLIAFAGPGSVSTSQFGVFEVDSGISPTAVDIDASAFLVLSGFYYTT